MRWWCAASLHQFISKTLDRKTIIKASIRGEIQVYLHTPIEKGEQDNSLARNSQCTIPWLQMESLTILSPLNNMRAHSASIKLKLETANLIPITLTISMEAFSQVWGRLWGLNLRKEQVEVDRRKRLKPRDLTIHWLWCSLDTFQTSTCTNLTNQIHFPPNSRHLLRRKELWGILWIIERHQTLWEIILHGLRARWFQRIQAKLLAM